MKHSKAIETTTIARLLGHVDENGMGRIFMYAFVNEVIRQKRPFSFDCETAQVNQDLMIIDNKERSIAIEHKRNQLSLTLNDQHTEAFSRIKYKGKAYRQVILAWLSACIWYTSLQPNIRSELEGYARGLLKKTPPK